MDEDYNIIYFSVWHQRQPFQPLLKEYLSF